MNTGALRCALVGAGKMGSHHARASSAVGGSSLVAIVDPLITDDQATEIAPESRRFADLDEMLREMKPDIVHVCTPPHSHAATVLRCLEAGAHVYVEKPVCLREDEARELSRVASERGLVLCAGHQLLKDQAMIRLRDRLGAIGRVVHIESYFAFRKVRKNLTLVGQAIDILPHPTYLLVDVLEAAAPNDSIVIDAIQATARGEVRAHVQAGAVTASVIVTLAGRPVDHYLRVIGTNGTLVADFIRGSVVRFEGPGAGFLPMLTIPFGHARQVFAGGIRAIFARLRSSGGAYPGLRALISDFYAAVRAAAPSPTSAASVISTVSICERIGTALEAAEHARDQVDLANLESAARATAEPEAPGRRVLVTGGGGFLGKQVVSELVARGYRVRSVSRSVPAPGERAPNVEYRIADLSGPIDAGLLHDVALVVHCAAATEGGEAAHQKSTIDATQSLLEASHAQGVRRFIHVSSLAVLRGARGRHALRREDAAIDRGSKRRGPYVWGKAEAEARVVEFAATGKLQARIIRPGPIVDYVTFEPPGRLGRDLGSLFVAVGSPRQRLAVVNVSTVATVIGSYVDDFDAAPAMLNLVEAEAPTRGELVERVRRAQSSVRVVWFPSWLMAIASPVAVLAQKLILKSTSPVDLAAAFASETYDTTLAREVIALANARSRTQVPG